MLTVEHEKILSEFSGFKLYSHLRNKSINNNYA